MMRLWNVIGLLFFLSSLSIIRVLRSENLVIPHDAHPGHTVKKYSFNGQTFHIVGKQFSENFAILSNGILMLTSDISHRIGQPIALVVKEQYHNVTLNGVLVVHVKHKNHMLKFGKNLYSGSVFENFPCGTIVQGLEDIVVSGVANNHVTYSIVSGNDDNSFSVTPSSPNRTTAVAVVTNHPLDREQLASYKLVLRVVDELGVDNDETVLHIDVLDVNDNPPISERDFYDFQVPLKTEPFSVIGNVTATDMDGDHPVYHFCNHHSKFSIIPKTGQVFLTGILEPETYQLRIRIHDNRSPRLYSHVIPLSITAVSPDSFTIEETLFDFMEDDMKYLSRSKRSVRPTKSYEYKENDGSIIGQTMFQLEKTNPQEIFQIESPNQWVQVDRLGVVRVKEPWNYEQLGKEKTIDFWVYASQPGVPGTFC
ncbi:neural-cadherin-like [Limulus polyphemus]|uniref:Neural-cadherin-like n=1 Tax=Limulus polyphemus TaxID=6850 RepID=A0ABM1C5A4_LIMPO|nr:neural-cadherin-like [Limulus polyphemus]